MKKSLIFIILLFISGCSSYDPSEINILNSQKIQGIKNWNIVYDSTSGLMENTNSLIDNETPFTIYKNAGSSGNQVSPGYKYSEMRGRTLSIKIEKYLEEKGMNISENAPGTIIISRPMFLNKGRYILHTNVSFLDNDKNEIAELDIYNNCWKRNSARGIHYVATGDIMDDNGFAVLCAEKIYSILNK
jgi:hypothetical protein